MHQQNSLSNYTIKSLLNQPSPVEKYLRQGWLKHCLKVSDSFLLSHADDIVDSETVACYFDGVAKLEQGKPLAYLTGTQGFWQHDFLVNEHTLIPRPDTEILVETVLNLAKNSLSRDKQSLRILDLGTGSGCIAISLADELPTAHVMAIDRSNEALAIARQNADRVGVSNVKFLSSHWFDDLPQQTFDIIVSNPPYIDPTDPHLAELTDEPITALVADNHGLADIEQIVREGQAWLSTNGLLSVEHGYDQAEQVQAVFNQHGFEQITTVKDFGGNDRVTYGFLTK